MSALPNPLTGSEPGGALPAPSGSLFDVLRSVWSELPGLVSDRVHLLSLELRRAGQALAKIVMLIVATAILGVTAWVALWGTVVGGLAALGLHWTVGLLTVLLVNLTAAALAVARMRQLAAWLQLPATLRHLTLSPVPPPPPQSPADEPTPPREAATTP